MIKFSRSCIRTFWSWFNYIQVPWAKNSEIVYGEQLQPSRICFFSHLFHTFIFSAIDCFRPFHFNRWFFELIELLRKKTQGFPGDRRHDWELCRYFFSCEWYCLRRNVLNYVKVIFLPDILSHLYSHIYSWRFTHKRIQSGGFGLPELLMDSTLP